MRMPNTSHVTTLISISLLFLIVASSLPSCGIGSANDPTRDMKAVDTTPTGTTVEIFKIGSNAAVQNGGTSPSFEINIRFWFSEIWTYHWNGGGGTAAGTISLVAADGTTYGPWTTTLNNGVYWVAYPNMYIPAGTYTVIDSDPSTWSQNSETGGQGMCWANGIAS